MSSALHHDYLAGSGGRLHYVQQGSGPLVVFCHGFPGLWYSWRHQMEALATAGYRALALDMRGYGQSEVPAAVEDYDLEHVCNDLATLLDTLGETQAVFVGHDFGAPVVWYMAQRYPQRVKALVVLSVPYDFDYYGHQGRGSSGTEPPSALFARAAGDGFLHAHYFQQPGVADRELGQNPAVFLRRIFWALSAGGDLLASFSRGRAGMGYLEVLPEAPPLPWPWLSEADFEVYVEQYRHSGFSGGLNWYRVADRNWQLTARFADSPVEQSTLFIAGEQDPVLRMLPESALDLMRHRVPHLQEVLILPDAGHWVQQEQAQAVNAAVIAFLKTL